ncbi:MAG: oligopeptide/dipeptide ABC transporter ATP-binding protein [Haloferacaceae archaeon]
MSDARPGVTEGGASTDAKVRVRNLKKYYPVTGGILNRKLDDVQAVDDVSFDIEEGETLGLVGESGCGKSTLGFTLMRMHEATAGSIQFEGNELTGLSSRELRPIRKDMQLIFQDPASSLDPRMTVQEIIDEPMAALTDWSNERRRERIVELVNEVGLSVDHLGRAPHEFSGGQQQRIAIARALSVKPSFLVCDEPTSALDVSVQADILNLMMDMQEEYDLTYLFISHDLSVVKHISDRVAVMYLGEIVELAETGKLFDDPKHPYTKALLSAVPKATAGGLKDRIILEGDVPSPQNPPSGCRFHTRCQEYIGDVCETVDPELLPDEGGHEVACHHYTDVGDTPARD